MPLPVNTTPIPRQTARLTVFQRLRTWVEEGVLAPGEVIRDVEIAEALGVSRTPVREAIQMLEQVGAVEVTMSHSTRVSETTPADAGLVYPPLAVLHGLAAEVATPLARSADVSLMREITKSMLEMGTAGDAIATTELDRRFHGVLLRLADNAYLDLTIDVLQVHSRRLEILYFEETSKIEESAAQHELICDAVASGDAARAGRITRENFLRGIPGQLT